MRKRYRRRRSSIAIRKRKYRSRSRSVYRRKAPKIRPENKYLPVALAQSAIAAPTFYVLNALTQGDNASQRVGNKVIGTGLHMNGFVLNRSASQQLMRIVFIKWLQIAPPASVTDVLQANAITSNYDPNQVNVKFKVIKDFTLRLSPASAVGGIQKFKVGFRLKNYVQYQGPNAADWTKNVIYMLVYPSAAQMDMQYESMYRYVDS